MDITPDSEQHFGDPRIVAHDYVERPPDHRRWSVSTVLQTVGDAFECAVFDENGQMEWSAETIGRDEALAWHKIVLAHLIRCEPLPEQPEPKRLPR